MSCFPFDLRDYFLQELSAPQRLQVEAHANACAACREELERLQLTGAALFTVRDEEIPQRIAFVSDKIFEPSPVRRWFTAFWSSTARLGFASALVLSVALTFSGWRRVPAPAPGKPEAGVIQPTPASAMLSQEELDRRIQAAVVKAVTDVQAKYEEKSRVQLAAFQRQTEITRQRLEIAAANYDFSVQRSNAERASRMTFALNGEEPR